MRIVFRPLTALLVGILWVSAGRLYAAEGPVKIALSVKDRVEQEEARDEDIKENAEGTEITTTTELETEVCTLSISISLKSPEEAACRLEWYFLSEYTAGREDDEVVKIFSPGSKDLRLKKAVKEELSIVSDPFVFKTIQRDNSSSDDKSSGDVYKGYIVLVTSGGEILAKASNSSRYLKEEWISKCKAK